MKKILLLGVVAFILSIAGANAYTQMELVSKQEQYMMKIESRVGDRLQSQSSEKLENVITRIDALTLKYEFSTELSDLQRLDKVALLGAVKQIIQRALDIQNGDVEVVKNGDVVAVHYILSIGDGIQKESSREIGFPLEFIVGAGQVIKGWDKGLVGRRAGDKFELVVAPEDGYGFHDDTKLEIIQKLEIQHFVDAGYQLEVGTLLPTQFGKLKIIDTDETTVTIDVNHELAGETLFFDMELMSIDKGEENFGEKFDNSTQVVVEEESVKKLELSIIKEIKKDSYIKGNDNAEILWLKYAGMQDPFTAKMYNSGTQNHLDEKYGTKLGYSLQHFPLDFHTESLPAAHYLECVGKLKGEDDFFQLEGDMLGAEDSSVGFITTTDASLNIVDELMQCVEDEEFSSKIVAQQTRGENLFGITGTPGNVLINTKTGEYEVISGAYPLETFVTAIDKLLQ